MHIDRWTSKYHLDDVVVLFLVVVTVASASVSVSTVWTVWCFKSSFLTLCNLLQLTQYGRRCSVGCGVKMLLRRLKAPSSLPVTDWTTLVSDSTTVELNWSVVPAHRQQVTAGLRR